METVRVRAAFLLIIFAWLFSLAEVSAAPFEDQPGQEGQEGQESAEEMTQSIVHEQLEHLPATDLETFWDELMSEYGGFLPETEVKSIFQLFMPGSEGFHFQSVVQGLINYLFQEIRYSTELLGTVIVLTVFAMILNAMQSSFDRQNVSKVAYAVTYMVLLILIINSFRVAMALAYETIRTMVDFMLAMIPLLLSLLLSLGNLATAGIFHPLLIFMVNVIGNLISTVVLPLIFLASVMAIVSTISERYRLSQFADLLQKVGLGLLAVMSTAFLSVISMQGITAAAADGITLRTAKYIAGNFVPVVGRLFADSADTVLGASLLVKNAVGMTGVVILFLIIGFPALKLIVMSLIYLFAGAIMQPLGGSPVSQCLLVVGKYIFYMFAAMAVVGILFFLSITILITAGNATMMMR